MNAELRHRLNYEILILERTRKEYASRLKPLHGCNGVLLRRTKRSNNKYYFYEKRPGEKSFRYLGRESHSKVKQIREARFLEEAIKRIDCDIALMKSLAESFRPFDPGSVSENLPAIYRCEVPPVSELYERESAEWKARRLEFQNRFPENYPQNKRHRTSDGVKVKTISELVLYEKFKDAGLTQIYELPLPLKDYGPPVYPDFTILSPVDLKTEIIVEFVGRLDKPGYREDFAKRLGRYIDSGYIPGVNLFFVYGDKDGNIDSTQITKVIADIRGLRDLQTSK